MEEYIIKSVLSAISWATLFLFIRNLLLSKRSVDFCSRTISTVHALLGVTLASLSVQDWNCPLCPLASKPSPHQMTTLVITSGYMIYDLLCCLFYKKLKVDDMAHHLIVVVGIGFGLAYERCGSEMMGALWITEISTPLLHLRENLKEFGYRDTPLNLAVDICFATIFSFARMIGGSYLTYVVSANNNPIILKATSVGLLVVSAFWFVKIARMVIYKLSKTSKPNSLTSKSC